MLKKLCACLVALVLLSAPTGCALKGEAAKQAYPEAWAYLKSAYGDYVRINDDGDFAWDFGDGVITRLLPVGEYSFYAGEGLALQVVEVKDSAEIGYAVQYEIINQTSVLFEIYFKQPKLQVYLDEHWWTLETQPQPGSEVGIWLARRQYLFLLSMLSKGAERAFPSGTYRVLADFRPEIDVVLCDVFEHVQTNEDPPASPAPPARVRGCAAARRRLEPARDSAARVRTGAHCKTCAGRCHHGNRSAQ